MASIEELERDLNEKHAATQKARAALDAAKEAEAAKRMEPLRALVERAHDCLCQWNHTDGCSWGYEQSSKDPWGCQAHSRWLRHYDKIINGDGYSKPQATLAEVTAIVDAIEGLKPKVRTAITLLRGGLQP